MYTGIKYSVKIQKGIKKWGTAWTNSLAYLGHTEAMQDLAKGYRYYINRFVPKESGDLRRSARAKSKAASGSGSATVYWGTTKTTEKYAHYQFVGDVYGPNKAHFNDAGVHDGWTSPRGKGEKENTHRKMGVPFTYELKDGKVVYVKGYTTPGTGYDWIEKFKKDSGDYGETAVNIRAGRFMYEMFCVQAKKEGWAIKPVGGLRIYHSWRQIKNIVD